MQFFLVFEKIYSCLFIPNCSRNQVITRTNGFIYWEKKRIEKIFNQLRSIWKGKDYTSFLCSCCGVSHFPRFNCNGLDCERVVCIILETLYQPSVLLHVWLLVSALVAYVSDLWAGFSIVDLNVIEPYNSIRIIRLLPRKMNSSSCYNLSPKLLWRSRT